MKVYRIIGLMSGSSCDGLDVAACTFNFSKTDSTDLRIHSWQIEKAVTISFPESLQKSLLNIPSLNASQIQVLDQELGQWIGNEVNKWIQTEKIQTVCIVSHGHTTQHIPTKGISTQIGDASQIHAQTGLPVLTHLRQADIESGGQGAPLAPLVDSYCFPDYVACLNLGGIANISIQGESNTYIASDICGCNQILNALAVEVGKAYDAGGEKARKGKVIPQLFDLATQVPYCQAAWPKSLSNAQVQEWWTSLFLNYPASLEDRLCTAVDWIASQIYSAIKTQEIEINSILCTGGGAFNTYLIERMNNQYHLPMHVPDPSIVKFKESLLMALIGVFKLESIPYCRPEWTGAKVASCGGVWYK